MKNLVSLSLIIGLVLISFLSFAQKSDSVVGKNVIKYNLSASALCSRAFCFSMKG